MQKLCIFCQLLTKKIINQGFYFFICYIDTDNWGLKVPSPYKTAFRANIPITNPRQETFLVSVGFESAVMLATLSDVSWWLTYIKKDILNLKKFN